jgi:ankyrin repeat protein
VDINAKNRRGQTALMFAALKGHIEVVKEMIAGGVDVNAIDKEGTTALMRASLRGHVEAVKALVRRLRGLH